MREILFTPIARNNPIALQVLGVCSALAVTTRMDTSLVMSIAVICVLTLSNVFVSLLRNGIPTNIRIIVQLTIIASLVIIVDQVPKLLGFHIHKEGFFRDIGSIVHHVPETNVPTLVLAVEHPCLAGIGRPWNSPVTLGEPLCG